MPAEPLPVPGVSSTHTSSHCREGYARGATPCAAGVSFSPARFAEARRPDHRSRYHRTSSSRPGCGPAPPHGPGVRTIRPRPHGARPRQTRSPRHHNRPPGPAQRHGAPPAASLPDAGAPAGPVATAAPGCCPSLRRCALPRMPVRFSSRDGFLQSGRGCRPPLLQFPTAFLPRIQIQKRGFPIAERAAGRRLSPQRQQVQVVGGRFRQAPATHLARRAHRHHLLAVCREPHRQHLGGVQQRRAPRQPRCTVVQPHRVVVAAQGQYLAVWAVHHPIHRGGRHDRFADRLARLEVPLKDDAVTVLHCRRRAGWPNRHPVDAPGRQRAGRGRPVRPS